MWWYGIDMTSLAQNERALPAGPLLAADGSPRLPHVAYDDDGYPYSDGAPLGQNTPQTDQLFYAFPALRRWLRLRFPDAFAACDMFVYPRKGDLKAAVAPDMFVAFGAGDHARNSYKLWEAEPVPAFVLEVLSGTTADVDLGPKRAVYATMGVRELWLFDPDGRRVPGHVAGYRLHGRRYRTIRPVPGVKVFPSGVLGLEFRAENGNLRIRDPATGEDLRSLDEAERTLDETERTLDETERTLDETERTLATARQETQAANRRATAAEERAVRAEAEVARLKSIVAGSGPGTVR